jgi:chitosanase
MNDLQKQTIKAIVNVFETGKIKGDYGAVAVLPGDSGHLSYGRSQATLGGGSLFSVLEDYCGRAGAQFADGLKAYLPRVQGKDFTLDHDAGFRGLLKQAGGDPVMQAAQDNFFDRAYFLPACQSAEAMGIVSALGVAVAYDGCIQGGWARLKSQLPAVAEAGGERNWIARYVALRRAWLVSRGAPLAATAYRMDAFAGLIALGNYDLALPVAVHGTTITADNL